MIPATMKEGDVYFWRWKSTANPSMSYHCKAQKAIVQNGRLVDTYWNGNDDYVLNLDEVIVTHQGNIHEMAIIKDYNIAYYRRDDIVDMRHANSSNAPIYLRNGAKRDANVIAAEIERRKKGEEYKISMARFEIGRLQEAQKLLAEGRLDEVRL